MSSTLEHPPVAKYYVAHDESGLVTHTGTIDVQNAVSTGQAKLVFFDDEQGQLSYLSDLAAGTGSAVEPIPPVGTDVNVTQIYQAANGDHFSVRVTHTTTTTDPTTEPDNWLSVRPAGTYATWTGNGEQLWFNDRRTHDGTDYEVLQTHVTQPSWEPGTPGTEALFRVFVAPAEGQWAPRVNYLTDDVAEYDSVNFVALQDHVSQEGWEPNKPGVLGVLWGQEVSNVWAVGVAYEIGNEVWYPGVGDDYFRCVQAHTSTITWTPPATPALWSEISPP